MSKLTPTEEDVKAFRNTTGLFEEEAFGAWIGDKAEPLVDAKNKEAFKRLRAVIPDGFADDDKIRKYVHERVTYNYKDITNYCIDVMVENGWTAPGEFEKF